jgi:hypothetical protein
MSLHNYIYFGVNWWFLLHVSACGHHQVGSSDFGSKYIPVNSHQVRHTTYIQAHLQDLTDHLLNDRDQPKGGTGVRAKKPTQTPRRRDQPSSTPWKPSRKTPHHDNRRTSRHTRHAPNTPPFYVNEISSPPPHPTSAINRTLPVIYLLPKSEDPTWWWPQAETCSRKHQLTPK